MRHAIDGHVRALPCLSGLHEPKKADAHRVNACRGWRDDGGKGEIRSSLGIVVIAETGGKGERRG